MNNVKKQWFKRFNFTNTFVHFSKSHVELDPKEQLKLEKIANESGFIKKEDFIEFAKKSSSVKEVRLRSSRSSTPVGRKDIDKAEIVFRVKLIQ